MQGGSGSWSRGFGRIASLSMAVHGLGIALAFIAQIVIARLLGAEDFGLFAWALAAVNAAIVLAKVGLDTAVLRFGAAAYSQGDNARFAALVAFAQRRVMLVSLAVAPLLVAGMIASRGRQTNQAVAVAIICGLWFPLLGINGVRQAALLARGWVVRSYVPETIVRPLVLLACVVALATLWSEHTARAAVASAGIAALAAYLVGRYWMRDIAAAGRGASIVAGDRTEWTAAARGLFWLTTAYAALSQADLLALGAVATPADLGIYSAARQIASVSLFGLFAIQVGLSPQLAAAHANRDLPALRDTVNFIAWVGLAFAVGAVALILLARNLLLSLFGTEFEHGVTALYVLLLAQVAVAVNGPAGIVASMTGCEGAAAKAYFIALVTVGSVTVVFYDRLGILAPALGVLAGTLLWGTLLRLHIARIVGVSTVPRISILRHAIRRSGS